MWRKALLAGAAPSSAPSTLVGLGLGLYETPPLLLRSSTRAAPPTKREAEARGPRPAGRDADPSSERPEPPRGAKGGAPRRRPSWYDDFLMA